MKPAMFELVIPETIDEAIAALSSTDGEAKILAGGQSLVALLNFRLSRPDLLIDINRIPELAYIKEENGELKIGAMTRYASVMESDIVKAGWPLLIKALPFVAHAPIRNRGTLGGSIAHADSGAEMCGIALALDARVVVRGPEGSREIPVSEFFIGPFMTQLGYDELLTEVVYPAVLPGTKTAFVEVARRSGDFAMCGVGTALHVDANNIIDRARLAYISMGSKPIRAIEAENSLIGKPANTESFAEAAQIAHDELNPSGDLQASEAFRRHLARSLTRRVLAQADA